MENQAAKRIFRDGVLHSALVGISFIIAVVLYITLYSVGTHTNADWLITMLRYFHPKYDGLADHFAFLGAATYTLACFIFISIIALPVIRKRIGHSLPWLMASLVGIVAGMAMLINMRQQEHYILDDFMPLFWALQATVVYVGYRQYMQELVSHKP